MQEELKKLLNKKPTMDDAMKMQLNITTIEKFEKKAAPPKKISSDFSVRIDQILKKHHTAKEMVELMIKAALEVEYGTSFVASKGFRGMTSKIADSIITNPDLRRQALSVASLTLEKQEVKIKQ